MIKYLVHAVGMFEDFKHYHISFVEQEYIEDELHSTITAGWRNDAEELMYDRVGKMPKDVYIVGFNILSK